jgi:hypothetical protein
MFPILLFLPVWPLIYYGFHILGQPIGTLFGTVLCQILLVADALDRGTHSLYARLFLIWACFTLILSLLLFTAIDFQIACWVFSSLCWQSIRILLGH